VLKVRLDDVHAAQRGVPGGQPGREDGLPQLDGIAAHDELAGRVDLPDDVDDFGVVGQDRDVHVRHADVAFQELLQHLLDFVFGQAGERDVAEVVVLDPPVEPDGKDAGKLRLVADIHADHVIPTQGVESFADNTRQIANGQLRLPSIAGRLM